jgi:HEAT repeat protein
VGRRPSRLDRAWRELGSLRAADPADVAQVQAAATSPDSARRQVAANLLREAEPGLAAAEWTRLVEDPARPVRRATVDAMVDVAREDLRPLLEKALDDADHWVRWKALRGLNELGPGPSRHVIARHAEDPNFQVRLEAAAALGSEAERRR